MKTNLTYAFFDVDDTLIRTKSMFAFYRFWCLEYLSDETKLSKFQNHFKRLATAKASREVLNREYYRFFAGVSPLELAEAGEAWATGVLLDPDTLFYRPTTKMLDQLVGNGVSPVFVSGSFVEVLEPLARYLGVHDILATPMQISHGGVYSGEIGAPQTIGDGKATAIQQFLTSKQVSASSCAAFGDDISDLPMLEAVGHPYAVGQDSPL